MADASRKRSRFDQTDSASGEARKSRFDRRSRSPTTKGEDSARRSRSPLARATESPAGGESKTGGAAVSAAAAAAAAAAAKIAAQVQAQKAAGTLVTTPVQPVKREASHDGAQSSSGGTANGLNLDIYEQDGDWIKDIEVNDLRNRYTLTKGATQKMIKENTGADVTTRGAYYPDKSMATAANPPLYLHITSTSKEGLEAAVKEIEEMMKQALPNLIDERRLPRDRRREPDGERDERGRRKWPEERIPIQLEPINGFNLRAQVVGAGGSYVKHIQTETGARVQIKGRGSGYYEQDTGVESEEPMYLHVVAPEVNQVEQARELCVSLLENVKQQYEQYKERGGRGGFGGDRRSGGGGYGGNDRDRSGSYGNAGYNGGGHSQYGGQSQYGGNSQYGGAGSPVAAAQGGDAAGYSQEQMAAAWSAYYAQNPGQDPYAQYGGYDNYLKHVQQYSEYYAAQGTPQQQQAYGQTPGYGQPSGEAAPPPPPPGNDASPPPPPPPGAAGYNAVPPPPGM